jgi:hypothetical protein
VKEMRAIHIPFALSLSKGSHPFGAALKKKAVLRQAQDERVLGCLVAGGSS